MKYLRLRLSHTPESIHPMHEFEIQHEDFSGSELLCWNPSLGESNAMIYRVHGPPAPYAERLERRSATVEYSVSTAEAGVFFCYVCERLTDRDRSYVEAFTQGTLVVVPPVRYNQDRTIDVTLVGTPSSIDAAFERYPEESSVDVLSVGDYEHRAGGPTDSLTRRQREVVAAAIDCGYYRSPREGSLSDVAAELDITTSTAAEHLRKAEARLIPRLVAANSASTFHP